VLVLLLLATIFNPLVVAGACPNDVLDLRLLLVRTVGNPLPLPPPPPPVLEAEYGTGTLIAGDMTGEEDDDEEERVGDAAKVIIEFRVVGCGSGGVMTTSLLYGGEDCWDMFFFLVFVVVDGVFNFVRSEPVEHF